MPAAGVKAEARETLDFYTDPHVMEDFFNLAKVEKKNSDQTRRQGLDDVACNIGMVVIQRSSRLCQPSRWLLFNLAPAAEVIYRTSNQRNIELFI